jgi:hypothetical protein
MDELRFRTPVCDSGNSRHVCTDNPVRMSSLDLTLLRMVHRSISAATRTLRFSRLQNLSAIPCKRQSISQPDSYFASTVAGFCGHFSPSRCGDSETRDGCDHISYRHRATDVHVFFLDLKREARTSARRRHCSGVPCTNCVASALRLMLMLMLLASLTRGVLHCPGTAAEHVTLSYSNRCSRVVGHDGCIKLVQRAVFETPAIFPLRVLRVCRACSATSAAVGATRMTQVSRIELVEAQKCRCDITCL